LVRERRGAFLNLWERGMIMGPRSPYEKKKGTPLIRKRGEVFEINSGVVRKGPIIYTRAVAECREESQHRVRPRVLPT